MSLSLHSAPELTSGRIQPASPHRVRLFCRQKIKSADCGPGSSSATNASSPAPRACPVVRPRRSSTRPRRVRREGPVSRFRQIMREMHMNGIVPYQTTKCEAIRWHCQFELVGKSTEHLLVFTPKLSTKTAAKKFSNSFHPIKTICQRIMASAEQKKLASRRLSHWLENDRRIVRSLSFPARRAVSSLLPAFSAVPFRESER